MPITPIFTSTPDYRTLNSNSSMHFAFGSRGFSHTILVCTAGLSMLLTLFKWIIKFEPVDCLHSSQEIHSTVNRINNLFSGTFLSLRRYITVSSPIFIYFYPMGRLLFDVLDTWNIICWYSVCTWCPTEIENERNQYWVSFWIKYSRDFIWRCFEFYRALFFMLLSSSGAQIIHLS